MKTKESYSLPVYATEDYTDFQKLKGNREHYTAQVKRLVRVIEKDNEFTKENPVIVNEHMEVVDGQHRIAAYKAYQQREGVTLPIYYIIKKGMNIASARNLNAGSKAWLPIDYAMAYATEGNKEYLTYLKFVKKFPELSSDLIQGALSTVESNKADFREGNFHVDDEKMADKMLNQLQEIALYHKDAKLRHFGRAYLKIARHPQYDHARMLEQMRVHGSALYTVPQRIGEMAMALNTVFNMGSSSRVDLQSRN